MEPDGLAHYRINVNNTGRVLVADEEARAEIVKLQQKLTELWKAVEEIEQTVAGVLWDADDDDSRYGPYVLKPIDDSWSKGK